MINQISFRGLKLLVNEDINSVEYIADSSLVSDTDYLGVFSLLSEFCMLFHPKFLIINKISSSFKIPSDLVGFSRDIFFEQLKAYGVQKLIMVVDIDSYNKIYKFIEGIDPFIIGFYSSIDACNWIKKYNP